VRIALLSPYSWTYPGGVTRHIEALAAELAAAGHEPRILAPFDPDDARSRRLHRGARPQPRSVGEDFVSLGRTIGVPANGAVSNMAITPDPVFALRRELRRGRYDILHIHEPVVPFLSWDALTSAGELPLVGTFHTYSENLLTNGVAAIPLGGRRRLNRLHARIAVSEAAAWTARRFYGGRYRIVPETGNSFLSDEQVSKIAENYHYDEIAERVAKGPIRFNVVAQVADPSDTVDDATIHWPESREQVQLGTIELTEVVTDTPAQQKYIIFDPIPRCDGIEPSADPLLELRAAVYLLSGRRRRAATA